MSLFKKQLLPCPFCGNKQLSIQSNGIGDYYVVCGDNSGDEGDDGCGVRTSDVRCESPEQAVDRWNRRILTQATALVADERWRQVIEEKYNPQHDANHMPGELTRAAICYAYLSVTFWDRRWRCMSKPSEMECPHLDHVDWPWNDDDWKPNDDHTRNLVRAAALIVAEIDRLKVTEAQS